MSVISFGLSLFVLLSSFSLKGQSIFLPENGPYDYDLQDISNEFRNKGIDSIKLLGPLQGHQKPYKLDKKRYEFQVKDWFEQDWFRLQDMFSFDIRAFVRKERGSDFNSSKRIQYSKFKFDRKKFFHWKTVPAMREWGGLTHPPIKELTLPLESYDRNFSPIYYQGISSPFFEPELQADVDRVSRSELSFGNLVVPLADKEAFLKKLELIRNARESILISSLVFVCDESTKRLVNLLIRKHLQGLDVKVITDGFIGKLLGHRECLKSMRQAGIEVIETRDFFKHKLKAIYHTKTLVTDLTHAVAGGHNLIDADNTSRGVDFKNRDIDLYIKGPMVTDVAKQFVENWAYQSTLDSKVSSINYLSAKVYKKLFDERSAGQRGKNYYEDILGNPQIRMKGVCRFIKQAPYEDRHTIGKAYLKYLDEVESSLVIEDPIKEDTYIAKNSDAPFLNKLDNFDMFNLLHLKVRSLARNGKRIDYITTNINMAGNENVAILNERIRSQIQKGKDLWANWSLAKLALSNSFYGKPHYTNLMKDYLPFKNVRIWKHISFMHSKVFYFDRILASVGSYNFQHNATDQAYESTTVCLDEELNRKLEKILVEDMVNSIPLIYSELR
ncbi:MAG: phospholipase D-like domain-containing protein [Bacteriovoracia bacterium]